MISNYWQELDPNKKRIVAISCAAGALFLAVGVFSGEAEETDEATKRQESIRHLITDQNTRELGIDSLAAEVRAVSVENGTLRKELERVQRDLQTAQAAVNSSSLFERDLDRLRQDIEMLNDMNSELVEKVEENNKEMDRRREEGEEEYVPVSLRGNRSTEDADNSSVASSAEVDETNFFATAPIPKTERSPQPSSAAPGQEQAPQGIQIAHYSNADKGDLEDGDAEGKEEEGMYLPAGSILSGVFINGMDAPTGQGARRDPFPSTLRIQKEAILPNRFRADVRECFLIVSGYGDLSSERAYLRGETLSCIREDGRAIEARLDSYAVGEDGKAGVRGRLVSKQGQLIARSLMAGFMSGASKAFDVNPVPTINTNSTGQQQYQQVLSDEALQGAGIKGASDSLDRIAQFYIEMAEGIFPVIEVDAGREIEIIVSRGTSLTPR